MTRKRTRIAKGIFADKFGTAIIVSVQGTPREFRRDESGKPYHKRTPQALILERKRIDAREHLKVERVREKGETLAADALAYLKTLSGRSHADAENLLTHWLRAFGDRRRATITALELRQHAATWRCAASTFNHRRQVLISLYKALDGPSATNPVREIPKRQEIMGAPKALTYDVIRAALAKMPPTKTRARLKVMAYTGLPQMQVSKLTPEDWHGDQLRVTPRRKGGGAVGRWIPLSPDAKAALQEFADLKAWGPFSHSSLYKSWKRVGPKGSNPYSLRHSWITELYRRSNGDVLAVKQLALHAMLSQTERYAAAALDDRMAALVLPRKPATIGRGNRPKDSTSVQSVKRGRASKPSRNPSGKS